MIKKSLYLKFYFSKWLWSWLNFILLHLLPLQLEIKQVQVRLNLDGTSILFEYQIIYLIAFSNKMKGHEKNSYFSLWVLWVLYSTWYYFLLSIVSPQTLGLRTLIKTKLWILILWNKHFGFLFNCCELR